MATTGKSFLIALGIYAGACLGILLAFSWWRRAPWSKRFYAPKTFLKEQGNCKPNRIGARNPLAWITTTIEAPEESVIDCAGVDALMYLKILRFGMQLFMGVSLLSLIIILPINATGKQVEALMAAQEDPGFATSPFTFWIPSPPPMAEGQEPEDTQPRVVQPPDFYVDDIPPPPEGLEWWEYKPDVPLLPTPAEVYGSNYARYGWRYNAQYQHVEYRFSEIDKTTMANIQAGSSRLYAHAILAWAVTAFTLWLLYRFNREAIGLRMFFLLNSPPGAQSHTVLLTDIPGISYGTVLHRWDSTLLRFLPKGIKARLAGAAVHGVQSVRSQLWVRARSFAGAPGNEKVGADADNIPESSKQAEGNGDYRIAASRPDASQQLRVGVRAPEAAWAQAIRQLDGGASIQEVVDAQMHSIFGNNFAHAFLVRDTSQLHPLLAEHENLMRSATDLLDHYMSLKRRNRTIKPQKITVVGVRFGSWGLQRYGAKPVRADALQFYRDRLVEVRRLIAEQQEAAQDKVVPSAFVTFRTREAQVIAATSLLHHDTGTWRCHPAPGPEEVLWGNLGWRLWERTTRRMLTWAAFIVLALFYVVPVAAVQSLLALNSVTTWFATVPVLNALVTAILPGLALRLFLLVLPGILSLMNRFSGMVSEAQVDLGVVTKYFIFQVLTVFFGSFIAGSFANQIRQFLESPGSILTVLGTSAPQTAIFFTTYIMLQALLVKPLSLLRLFGLVMFWLRSRFAATERAKARVWRNQQQTYGSLIPDDTIAILLGLVFCLICPIIAPFALIYFAVAFVIWKYQLLYVKTEAYQSGGQVWTRVFHQVCFSLMLFQLVMVGILGIKRVVAPPLIVLPLLFITAFFWWSCHALFWRPQQTLSLADAASLDGEDRDGGPAGSRWQGSRGGREAGSASSNASQLYLNPAFKLSEDEFQAFLYESDAMLQFLATGERGDDLEAIQNQATASTEVYETAEEEVDASHAQASTAAASIRVEAERTTSGESVAMMQNRAAGHRRTSSNISAV